MELAIKNLEVMELLCQLMNLSLINTRLKEVLGKKKP